MSATPKKTKLNRAQAGIVAHDPFPCKRTPVEHPGGEEAAVVGREHPLKRYVTDKSTEA
jgi:hypothetical protein